MNRKSKLLNEETEKQVVDVLNSIAIIEFEYNGTLSEFNRIINYEKIREDERFIKCKEKIETLIKPFTKNYIVKVSEMGILIVSEFTKETELYTETTIKDELFYNVDLPYAYVMGNACGKRIAKSILEQYDYLLKRIQ